MRFHSIEVDDDVFAYLQSKAAPFIDTPNAVLRRELLKQPDTFRSRPAPAEPSAERDGLPDLPPGTPAALAQTLEVVWVTKSTGCSRSEANTFVAQRHRVAPQTVLDKYCRQLGLTADRFDAMLREAGYRELRGLLSEKFPRHQDAIAKVFDAIGSGV